MRTRLITMIKIKCENQVNWNVKDLVYSMGTDYRSIHNLNTPTINKLVSFANIVVSTTNTTNSTARKKKTTKRW